MMKMTMMMMTRKLKRRRQLSKLYFAKVTGREIKVFSEDADDDDDEEEEDDGDGDQCADVDLSKIL